MRFRRFLIYGISSVIILSNFASVNANSNTVGTNVKTIAGNNRYETAIKISQNGWNKASRAVLVNSGALADALCVTPLAEEYNSPILLIDKNNISSDVYKELNRLGVKDITLIGSENVVSSNLEKELKNKGFNLERIGGKDRYDTSLKIANKLNTIKPITKIAVVNGSKGLADATSIAAPAANENMGILYTNGRNLDSIDSFINSNIKKAYILGEETVISKTIENELNKNILEVSRVGGKNRRETNAKILELFFNNYRITKENIYVAKDGSVNESDLVDGLACGVLAAKNNSPLLLASNNMDIRQEFFVEGTDFNNVTRVGLGSNENIFIKVATIANSKTATKAVNVLKNKDGWIKYDWAIGKRKEGITFENKLGAYEMDGSIEIYNNISDSTIKPRKETIVEILQAMGIKESEINRLCNDLGSITPEFEKFSKTYDERKVEVSLRGRTLLIDIYPRNYQYKVSPSV